MAEWSMIHWTYDSPIDPRADILIDYESNLISIPMSEEELADASYYDALGRYAASCNLGPGISTNGKVR